MADILIIEDNAANHELAAYLLRSAGHHILSAWHGEEGIAIAERERPQLVLCDLQMPGVDGYQVVRRLKGLADLQGIPIIALTASSMAGDAAKALDAGFDAYMSKPIEPELFVSQVEAFLPAPLRLQTAGKD